jgi:hypothetical protein
VGLRLSIASSPGWSGDVTGTALVRTDEVGSAHRVDSALADSSRIRMKTRAAVRQKRLQYAAVKCHLGLAGQ